MRRNGSLATAAVAFVAALSGNIDAQRPPRHDGFNLSVGVGQGMLHTSCTGCGATFSDRANTAMVRAAWTISDRIILGASTQLLNRSWLDPRGETQRTAYTLVMGNALLYPTKRSEVFVKVGGGLSIFRSNVRVHGVDDDLASNAPALQFGIGSDLRLGRSWALTPYVDRIIGIAANSNRENVDMKTSGWLFGLALTWP